MTFATPKTFTGAPFYEGVDARQCGKPQCDNPYLPGYHDYLEWDFGWETEDAILAEAV